MDVKFLITCRLELEIGGTLVDIVRLLRIDSAKINTDLSKFIDVKVDELSRREVPSHIEARHKVRIDKKSGGHLFMGLMTFPRPRSPPRLGESFKSYLWI